MKKVLCSVFAVVALALLTLLACGCNSSSTKAEAWQKRDKNANTEVNAEKTVEQKAQDKSEYNQFQDLYTPAFQLIWNDFADKLVGHEVKFVGENPQILSDLNQRRLTEDMLLKKDYYKTIAPQTVKTKKTIEKAIKKQFNEKSQILDTVSWLKKDDGVHKILYCMFKKDIFFEKVFQELDPLPFFGETRSKDAYKMFGATKNQHKFSHQVKPVYYNDENDYAVKLLTKTGDEIILLASNSDEPVLSIWDKLYAENLTKKSHLDFDKHSKLIVPFVKLSKTIKYDELTGKDIVGSKYIIDSAIEVIDFSLDNTGARIKNEAMMGVRTTALRPKEPDRLYYFNKPFVLFIRAKDGKVPYFALKVKDTTYLQKG